MGFILVSTTMLFAQAQVIGVAKDNFFEYNMVAHWNSISTSAPAELLELNQTAVVRVTVNSVSGSVISTKVSTHFVNGTDATVDGSCNIDTGECIGLPFIAANLGKNDLVNPSASEAWYINETISRAYKDGPRETNHLKLQYNDTIQDLGQLIRVYDYYFDKSTGVLVEYTTETSYSDITGVTQSNLLASNVWNVGDNVPVQFGDSGAGSPTTLYIAVAATGIIIGVIAVFAVFKRRKSLRSETKDEE